MSIEPADQPNGQYYCWKYIDTRDVPENEKKHYVHDILTRNPEPPDTPAGISPCYLGMRDWAGSWFAHTTLDVGQRDEDVLRSFERYVDWVLSLPRGEYPLDDRPAALAVPNLMGAQDRWRWSGQPEDRNPPCRCAGCKARGVLTITH